MAYGFQSIKNSRTFLVVQLSPFPAPSQPRVAGYPAPATVAGSLQPQLLLKFWGRLLPGPGFGLAAAGSWRRGQVEVELRQATGGLGHAGLGRQKRVEKRQWEKSKKVHKKSNVRILALADYWRQKKVKKSHKKVQKIVKKKVKCENQARILALADYWRQQKVKKRVKKSQKKSILLATLGPDRAGYLGLWGGYQGHQGWLGAEEMLGQW